MNAPLPLGRNRRLLALLSGQGLSFLGDGVSMVALVVVAADLGGSTAVGWALLARMAPTVAGPAAGVLADRLDRRRLLVAMDLARAATLGALVFVRELYIIYALALALGAATTLFNPTIRASFPSVVGRSDLTRANSALGTLFSLSIAIGPLLGGALVAGAGVGWAFALDGVTYLISASVLATIPLPRTSGEVQHSFLSDLRHGLSYTLTSPLPLALVAGSLLVVAAINITEPAEIFLATETFSAGETGYGLVVAVWGGGMVVGSALVGALSERLRLVPLYLAAIFASAAGLGAIGASPSFLLALALLALAGAANGANNVAAQTLLQKHVPDALLGRVFALNFLGLSAGQAVAYPVGGLLVATYGIRETYLIAGGATALAGAVVALLMARSATG